MPKTKHNGRPKTVALSDLGRAETPLASRRADRLRRTLGWFDRYL